MQKPSIKPQTASTADLEAQWLGKTIEKGRNLGRNRERNQAEGWPVFFWLCRVEIIIVSGH
jgi:hypothetical protein